jgi:hypothetical protein
VAVLDHAAHALDQLRNPLHGFDLTRVDTAQRAVVQAGLRVRRDGVEVEAVEDDEVRAVLTDDRVQRADVG